MEEMFDVFISYRRDGGRDAARLLYKELVSRGLKCFFDFNSLRSGKFDEKIYEAIRGCRHFVLLVTDGAFDRCSDAGDWVRTEIEYAISNNKDIVPVAPSDQKQCFPASLPISLQSICNREISELNMGKLFERSVDQIIEDRFDVKYQNGVVHQAAALQQPQSKWQQLMAFVKAALRGEHGPFVKLMVQIAIGFIVIFIIAGMIAGVMEEESDSQSSFISHPSVEMRC